MKIVHYLLLLIATILSVTDLMPMWQGYGRGGSYAERSFNEYMEWHEMQNPELAERDRAINEARIEKQNALAERRKLDAKTVKSLQQTSAKHIIDQLLHANKSDKIALLQANSAVINNVLRDRIAYDKELLDPTNPEDLYKINKLDALELLIIDTLGKQIPAWYEKTEESTEKEEKAD